jgi:hypothetical protein
MLLSQILLNYDLEPLSVRPTNPWLNDTIGPPIWSTMRVRRRPSTTGSLSPTSTLISTGSAESLVELAVEKHSQMMSFVIDWASCNQQDLLMQSLVEMGLKERGITIKVEEVFPANEEEGLSMKERG